MTTPFRRWATCRARKEKTNSALALAQASEPTVSLLFSLPRPWNIPFDYVLLVVDFP